MASDKIKVDYNDLEALETKLTTIVNALGADGSTMTTLANAVGDHRLADKVLEYGKSWAVHRIQINEDIEWIRDQVRDIATKLSATDADLANGLKG